MITLVKQLIKYHAYMDHKKIRLATCLENRFVDFRLSGNEGVKVSQSVSQIGKQQRKLKIPISINKADC
ncbi:hypothetical protein DERP_010879 [Dermatophagoides pteronyssinus]|uniref:Uncharacterized protein n=1 Tax=Dermatophagoides pteronyssinus TaxID=6956 RepID=A0ABQ8JVN9_DERPT|nr:hypothetical protein DERP_010879 [Dermatophagoides pteronyssinus]